eukprot:324933-Rhodomonas_salina.1
MTHSFGRCSHFLTTSTAFMPGRTPSEIPEDSSQHNTRIHARRSARAEQVTTIQRFLGWDGGMEGWRDGGMEGWRDGGMEGRRMDRKTCSQPHSFIAGRRVTRHDNIPGSISVSMKPP